MVTAFNKMLDTKRNKQTIIRKMCSTQEEVDFGIDFDCETNTVFMKDTEIDAFILGQKTQITKYKDNSDLNTFIRFCISIRETRYIENIPAVQLNNILFQFLHKCENKERNIS